MAVVDVSVRLLERVNALSSVVETQIPANGAIWSLKEFRYYANPNQDTHARIVWDYQGANEEILAIGYGSDIEALDITITGDGIKILALIVQNDSAGREYIGGAYTAHNQNG